MKCCPNCGKVVPNDKNFCESCGSSVDFPGIRDDGPKKVQNNGKNSKNDNKEEIEILDTNVKKQEKYCCICGKKLDKKGICKECESSTFMPGVNKNDIYKFCGHCGQELNKDGICEQCGSSVIFPGIRESNQKQDKNSKKNNTEEIEVLDNNGKKQEKHCIKCNKKLNKNNRYCINCGKKIDRDFNTCLECTKKETAFLQFETPFVIFEAPLLRAEVRPGLAVCQDFSVFSALSEVLSDVAAVVAVGVGDFLHVVHGLLQCFGLVAPVAGHADDASAGGDEFAVLDGGAAVEDDGIGADLCEPLDGEAFLVFLRIAAGDEHHVDGGAGVEAHFAPVEVAGHDAFEEVNEVAAQAWHDGFRFRVAHAAVVFDDHGLALHIDESEEDETLVVDAFLAQSLYGGAHDAVFDLLHPFGCGEGYGRHTAHAAGVEAAVVFADALVVLGFGQYLVVSAVGEHEDGAFDAVEVFFNDHARGGQSEHAAEHFLQFLAGLLEGGQYEHAFAGAEAVGLEHVGRFEGGEEFQAFFQLGAVEGLVARRGYGVALHEGLGEVLAAFEPCSGLGGADDADLAQPGGGLEVVGDAVHQRVFGPYDEQSDVVVEGELADGGEVGHFQVDTFAQ